MNKVRKKLFEAKKLIANTPTKKEGTNTFSKYDYFTPSQVSKLVFDACTEVGLVTGFDLTKDNSGGYEGLLSLFDIDSEDVMSFQMATDMPEIKATNVTQKLGGMATYVLRYLEMNTFGIVDNNLDPDSQDNRSTPSSKPQLPQKKFDAEKEKAKATKSMAQFVRKCEDKYILSATQKATILLIKNDLV